MNVYIEMQQRKSKLVTKARISLQLMEEGCMSTMLMAGLVELVDFQSHARIYKSSQLAIQRAIPSRRRNPNRLPQDLNKLLFTLTAMKLLVFLLGLSLALQVKSCEDEIGKNTMHA